MFRFLAATFAVFAIGAVAPAAWAQTVEPTAPPASLAAPAPETATPPVDIRPLDVVFCVDCSGSMNETTNRAKQVMLKLLSDTEGEGTRIAVIRYGSGTNTSGVLDFTTDLNKARRFLSENVQAGGAEYVGTFVKAATEKLSWSPKPGAERHIYIVGNETMFQGPVDFRPAILNARSHGIQVSVMYCALPGEDFAVAQAKDALTASRYVKTGNGPFQRVPGSTAGRGALQDRNTWLLAAYLGGGELFKVSGDFNTPVVRMTPEQVRYTVEVLIPQEQDQMLNAYLRGQRVQTTRGFRR